MHAYSTLRLLLFASGHVLVLRGRSLQGWTKPCFVAFSGVQIKGA